MIGIMKKGLAAVTIALFLSGVAYAAQQTISSGSGVYWSDEKDKINDNFDELYADDAALGTASTRAAEDTMTDGANLPDGAAIKAYGDSNWEEVETNSLETAVTGIADTEIFVGDGADSGGFVVLSGDGTLANTGALTLANNSVENAMMADSAVDTAELAADAVEGTKVADDQIDSEHYVDGSIDTAHVAADQITEALIADDAVEESHLKAVDAAADEECLTYESTTGDFEWQTCGTGAGDVTEAGNNDFTGTNTHSGTETFTGIVNLPASITLPADSVDADNMADDDHGDVSWTTSVATVEAVSGANAVDSDAYVDASIDNAHLADDAVDSAELAAGAVDADHIASYTLSPIVIAEPDQVQDITDAVPLYHFIAETYPSGVTITSIHISTSATNTDDMNFEEWSNNGTAWSTDATVEAITLSCTHTEDDGTLADADIAADAWLYVDLDDAMSDIAYLSITISFTSQ